MRPLLPSIVCIAVWCCAWNCWGVDAPAPAENLAGQIRQLIVDLDAGEFAVRTGAFQRLERLSADEASRQVVAEAVERAIVDAEISFEVRKQLQRLRRDLPPASLAPDSAQVDAEVVDRLLLQLGDDSYARRLGAESRLHWLLGNADAADLIYRQVKRCAAADPLGNEQVHVLGRIYGDARAAWLEDEARKTDPAATAGQI
ncbi:MAG: hypothetical protein ACYC6Y_03040, partial [Thermoguttaceae bacterium]